MRRFFDKQARIGAFLGDGFHFISEKAALTRSQWLMLGVFVVGAVVVGFASTRMPRAQQTEAKPAGASVGATTAVPEPSTSHSSEQAKVEPTTLNPAQPAPVSSSAMSPVPPSSETTPPLPTSAKTPPERLADASRSGAGERAAAPVSGIQLAVLAHLEGLAKDIARLNQKLDDVSSRQKQTASRLTALIADSKQVRNSHDAEPGADTNDQVGAKAGAPAARRKAQLTAPPRLLTVHKKRVARRPTVDQRREANARAMVMLHRIEIAERKRRLHRRRLAAFSGSIFGNPLHLGRSLW